MSDLHEARVMAAAKAIAANDGIRHAMNPEYVEAYMQDARAGLAAADAVVTVDGLQERIEDTLAYYQCRETNPKADHPSMGYHAFSEEQREFLRERKAEAAAEIVRIIESYRRTDRSIIARQERYIEGLENVDRSPDAVVTEQMIAEVLRRHQAFTHGDSCRCGWVATVGDSSHARHQAFKLIELLRGGEYGEQA